MSAGAMKVCGKDIQVHGRLVRLARLAAEGYEFLDHADTVVEELRQSPSRIDLFTFTQNLADTRPTWGYPMEWDNVAAMHVSTFDHWWTQQINDKTRNMVRRAQKKGVTARPIAFDDTCLRGISSIYNESQVRQGRAFWHYGKDLETIRRENATFLERSVFIGAFVGNDMIGFAKLVSDAACVQAAFMQIVSMIQHRDKAPTNALVAAAVRSCAERGIPYLVYSKFAFGNKQRDSLSDFKEHNGFRRIEVPRYYIPVTLAGRWALAIGLHHRLAERIPEPVLMRLRKLRTFWHSRPSQAMKKA
jgi:hypothetical protein